MGHYEPGELIPYEETETYKRRLESECSCCGGSGEHKDGHECYACDASGSATEQDGAVCEGHHGTPDDGPENARERYGPGYEHYSFLETVVPKFNAMRARHFSNGYEGVTHAGIAIVAVDSSRVLLAKRAYDSTDDEDVRETYEFPGGSLNKDEEPFPGAVRELLEETYLPLPDGMVVGGWRAGPTDNYQGFVYRIETEFSLDGWTPTSEVSAVGWFTRDEAESMDNLRPEVRESTDWDMIFEVSGNPEGEEEIEMADTGDTGDTGDTDLSGVRELVETEPVLDLADLDLGPIYVHGVLAPEGTESGDGRGFLDGAMTSRPLRIPFRWQETDNGGHDGAVVVGSVDRLMRKDGLIHWEGQLMPSEATDKFMDLLAFFGRFGVSVDGDKGSGSSEDGVVWFDAVRAAGLTAVAIPAFAEAYVAFGPHPDMPEEDSDDDSVLVAGVRADFKRGKGWVTNPRETKRLHDYWIKGEGAAKIRWGTNGDWTRCTILVGEKIAKNSPDKLRFIKRICSQWHHDALGYWPGELGKPGNPPDTPENRRRAATHAGIDHEGLEASEDGWEAVLVSSVTGDRTSPPLEYFHRHDSGEALVITEPDSNGLRRTYGYAAEWGVCHVGINGQCVEPPITGSDDYPDFHLGRTRTDQGYINTGVLTYGIGHRDADTILSESPDQAYFDNVNNAWAAVRVGEDERGIWFSGVVLPGVDPDHIVKIEASGQVSGEWLGDAMRACLTVNVPGFPVHRASASYDENGNVMALAASAFSTVDNGTTGSECDDAPTPAERMAALASVDAEVRFQKLKDQWEGRSHRVQLQGTT